MTQIADLRIFREARTLFPGLLTAVTVALAARFLSEHYGAPVMLMALLIGMAFSFLTEDESGRCAPGIEFVSKSILRFGVALLGLGITIQQVVALGGGVVVITLSGVLITILAGLVLSRTVGRRSRFGTLTGGAVAICGASAALAISSVLPNYENKERDTVFTVIAVTALSTLAMIVYPILANILELSDRQAGVFLGATIHDVAQVVGAGYSISEETGDTATIVKLFRVALLVPIVIAISIFFSTRGEAKAGRLPVPLFVIGFVVLVVIGSYGLIPDMINEPVLELARWCLIAAISALGMKTSLKKLAGIGRSAIGLLFALTVLLAALSLGLITSTNV